MTTKTTRTLHRGDEKTTARPGAGSFAFPLSSGQQRLWFLEQLQPGSPLYNIPIAVRLEGPLDGPTLEHALNQILRRHEALRTRFDVHNDRAVQIVAPSLTLNLPVVDLQSLPQDAREAEAGRLAAEEARRPFDLKRLPLLRTGLLRLSDTEHIFVLTVHHIIFDGWSLTLFFRELATIYERLRAGKSARLPEPPIQYADFAVWQQQRLQSLDQELAWWEKHLRGSLPTLAMPTNRPRSTMQTCRGATESFVLPSSVYPALQAVSRQRRATLFMTLLAAFQTVLHRYTGQEDILVASPVAGRNLTETEEVIGLFVNTLVLRGDLSGNPTFLELLGRVRDTALDAYANQELPFDRLVQQLQPDRSLSHSPLFQVMFALERAPLESVNWCGLKLTQLALDSGTAKFDLTLCVVENASGLTARMEYNTDLFDAAAIARMLGHFKTLLESVADSPAQRLSQLPLLTETERHRLLVECNNTAADFPRDKCVHHLFEEQAARTPDALAVSDDATRLTYRDLNERADRIAARLQALGVGPEVRVGVCLERCVEMAVALLAVLKSGGAYVPLDPSYPCERLTFMLEDAKMPVLLTQRALHNQLQFGIPDLRLLCVEDLVCASPGTHREGRSSSTPLHSRNLAYVIYTSGSTGTPKGVEIEHASLVNLITWHQRTYRVTPSDRATQLATPAFDASVWELWPYLTGGASIHIPDNETRLSPGRLRTWLRDHQITLAFIPTPIVEALLDEPWPEGGALRAVLTGGDKLHRPPGQRFPCALLNHYGPTENTVVTTWIAVPPASHSSAAPPIGRPISNTQVYILDRHLQPVPLGVPGELHIGGASLARGYLNRPDLTAGKFIANPFSKDPQARLYKTGDLVRWLPDGSIEFLGRIDQQVKVRGNRVELGEVESVLSRHPSVREAAVAARPNDRGENRLVAYTVPSNGPPPSLHDLREFLKQRLPDHMVPSAFVTLDALPLTPNGKVDRSALPEPKLEIETAFVAPRTPAEEKLAGLWREVLDLPRAGIDDNFFELGGHSLLATQVISRVRSALALELPLSALFETPTIAGLAAKIEAARAGEGSAILAQPAARGPERTSQPAVAAEATLLPLVRRVRDGERPLSFAQERLWFLEQLEPGIPFNNIPIALRLEGGLNATALERALNGIVRRHETFRMTFGNRNGRPVAIVEPELTLQLIACELSALSDLEREAEARRRMTEEAQRPFDLTHGPLLRAKLFRLGTDQHLLLLVTHHIACDGWSMGVFCRELSALYEAFRHGRTSPLPELPMAYADFAHGQRQWLQGPTLDGQLAYWKHQLQSAQAAIGLRTDRPRPPRQSYRGATRCLALPAELSARLAQLGRQEKVTLFMLLLAAWQTLLHRYSGQDDILVGSPIAGRTRVETEGLIGFFLNTLVLRGDLSGDPTFRDLLKRVRQVALDAYAHQDVPFEKLVDALQPERDLSRSPLFQVMLVLQNEPLRPLQLSGLKVQPLHVHSGTAKFDLVLSLEDGPGSLGGFIEYSTDLFEASTIERMLAHFETLLEGVVTDPGQRLSQLPLLTAAERKQLLVEWNETRADFPAEKCVHQLFAEQAQRTPDAVAVVFGDQQLSYCELNRRADRLAEELRGLGVGPEVRAGLCVSRSLEMMVGLLGILKAGGCYVPLDPTYPKERLTFMLNDSGALVLATQENLQADLKLAVPDLKLLCLDAPRFASPSAPHAATSPSVFRPAHPDNLAYVIYTSGSTGTPKGVMLTHRNVVNFFAGMDRVLGTDPGVWLAVTSISFDISVLELFWTLARGFKVIIQPDEEKHSSAAARSDGERTDGQRRSVPEQIARHGVTHMQCTPSLAGALVLAPESFQAMRRLSKLLLGGEALPVSLAKRLRRSLRGDLLNMYGPTETTVWSTVHRVDDVHGPVPIGRPIANTEIYLLDPNLQPVPVGVPGELFIGGEGVARGYLNRPEFTKEKFVAHPFSADPGARLYRTGDLARHRTDGVIEFLGRTDHQIKLRGHRVELGEIEAALSQHSGVREAVVVARETAPGDQRLVAYLVAANGPAPSATGLRQFLHEKLPDYMVPSTFMVLDQLPLTPNGKVDRRALPEPAELRPSLETAYVAPLTPPQKTVAKIWQDLLHVEKVGLHDNFFDLGGHSLLVVQAQAKLREALGIDLPIVRLFQYPTINALTKYLSERGETASLQKVHDRARRQREAFARQHEREVGA